MTRKRHGSTRQSPDSHLHTHNRLSRSRRPFDFTNGASVGDKSSARYEQLNLGAAYSLPKATELYLTSAFQHASGTDSLRRPAVAQIGYLSPSATNKQVTVSAGIKHLF